MAQFPSSIRPTPMYHFIQLAAVAGKIDWTSPPIAMAALGIALLLFSLCLFAQKKIKYQRWNTADGKVVGVKEYRGGRGTSHVPVVEFHDSSGNKVRFEGRIGTPYQLGGTLPVRYHPSHSSDAFVDRAQQLYGRVYGLVFVSLILISFGVLYIARATQWLR